MLEKAIENLEKVKENPILSGFLAIAYTKNGQNQKAQLLVDRLKLISQKKAATSPEYTVGLYYSGTGQKEEALNWLERAYKSHDSELYWLKIEPMFETLHGDPRYEELLRKIVFRSERNCPMTVRFWPKAIINRRSETTLSGRQYTL